jgi:hypothetical protein
MSSTGTQESSGAPTYTGSGDAAHRSTDYYPWWLDKLADDVTLEASAMDGAARGPRGRPFDRARRKGAV